VIPSAVCVATPEDEQVMLETCRGPWFLINWIISASRWFHYTDIIWCTVNKILNNLNIHCRLHNDLPLNRFLSRVSLLYVCTSCEYYRPEARLEVAERKNAFPPAIGPKYLRKLIFQRLQFRASCLKFMASSSSLRLLGTYLHLLTRLFVLSMTPS
jgi:hypothetical protein